MMGAGWGGSTLCARTGLAITASAAPASHPEKLGILSLPLYFPASIAPAGICQTVADFRALAYRRRPRCLFRYADKARLAGIDRGFSAWPDPRHLDHDLFIAGAVIMYLPCRVDHHSAGRDGRRCCGIEFLAGAGPPGALDHRADAHLRMRMRA